MPSRSLQSSRRDICEQLNKHCKRNKPGDVIEVNRGREVVESLFQKVVRHGLCEEMTLTLRPKGWEEPSMWRVEEGHFELPSGG